MPLDLLTRLTDLAPVFTLVLFRVAGLVSFAPLFSMMDIPVRVRIILILALAGMIWPLVRPVVWQPDTMLGLALGIAGEIAIGLTMGLVVSLMFAGAQIGAELISQQVGFSMSEMMDPITGTQSTLLAQLFLMIATLIFVLMNGHLIMLRSLIESFGSVPLLSFHADQSVLDLLVTVLTSAFQVGIRMAGPTLVAIFLTTLTMGFISRTMPQLNILAVGFPLHILLGMFVMIASMAMITAIMEDSILYALRQIGLLFL